MKTQSGKWLWVMVVGGGRGRGQPIAAAAVVVNAAQLSIRGLSPATQAPALAMLLTS